MDDESEVDLLEDVDGLDNDLLEEQMWNDVAIIHVWKLNIT